MLVAASLLAFTLLPAAPASAASCVNLLGEPTPVTPTPGSLAKIELCDTTHDGDWDTVNTQTYPVYSDAHVTVAQEDRPTPSGTHEHAYANTMLTLGIPTDPVVWANVQADDHHGHGDIDQVIAEGGLHVGGPTGYAMETFIGAWDVDGDGTPDAYGFIVCDTLLGCLAPSEPLLMDVVDEIVNLVENPPDVVVFIPGVGWIP